MKFEKSCSECVFNQVPMTFLKELNDKVVTFVCAKRSLETSWTVDLLTVGTKKVSSGKPGIFDSNVRIGENYVAKVP